MAEWVLIMINEDDAFGESLARAVKRLLVVAFAVGCLVGAGAVWLVAG